MTYSTAREIALHVTEGRSRDSSFDDSEPKVMSAEEQLAAIRRVLQHGDEFQSIVTERDSLKNQLQESDMKGRAIENELFAMSKELEAVHSKLSEYEALQDLFRQVGSSEKEV